MIDFYESKITDLLPYPISDKPEIQALAYAIKKVNQKILDHSKKTRLYSGIEDLSETTLDVLAIELRTPYYDQTMPISTKKEVIKNTLQWHLKRGTPSVIAEYLRTVLGGGTVEEWFDYQGEPFHFRILLNSDHQEITLEMHKKIKKQILEFKNARSFLEMITYLIQETIAVTIQENSRLFFLSEVYPRGNQESVFLDGNVFLDGESLLNGDKSLEIIDPYPLVLSAKSTVQKQIKTREHLSILSCVAEEFRCCTSALARTEAVTKIKKESRIECRASVSPNINYTSRVIVEKDMWYLDGTILLDGSASLQATSGIENL